MAEEELEVRASLRDGLTAPLRGVKRSVREVADEVDKADRKARSYNGTLNKLASSGAGAARVLGRGLAVAAGIGATALGAAAVGAGILGGKLIGLASDAAETASKFETVFGRQAGAVDAWVKRTNAAYGITTKELQDVTSRFGVFGKAAGIASRDLPKFSTELAAAGLDLSSFYNVDPEEAFTALSSGLAGEAEPLRRFGIFLSDATMRAEAATMGLTGELTESQKVAVRQRLILKSLGDANGDLARTSDSFANKTRALKGRLTELGTQLGTALLPAAGAVVNMLDDKLSPIVERLTEQAPALADAVGGKRWDEVALRLGAVTGSGTALWETFDNLRNIASGWEAFGAIGAAFQADEALGTGSLIEDTVTKIIEVGEDLRTLFRDGINPAIEALGPVGIAIISPLSLLDDVLGFMADHATELRPLLTGLAAGYAGLKAARVAADGITAARNAADKASGAFRTIRGAVAKASGPMRRFFAPGGGSDGLRLRLMAVREHAGKAGRALRSAATSAGRWARAGARSAAAWGRGKLTTIADNVKRAGSALRSAAASAGRWALAGIRSAAAWVRATAATVANRVATMAQSAASKVAAAIQWALNAAMSANPVTLIVIGIVALVAALVLAYNKVGWFRNAVDAAFRFIGRAVGWVVDFIKRNWEFMLAAILGPFGIAIGLIVNHWDKVKGAVSWVIDKVVDLWAKTEPARALLVELGEIGLTAIKDAVGWLILKVVDLWAKTEPARDLLVEFGDIALTTLKDAVGWVVDKLQWLIDNGGKVAGFVGDVVGAVGNVIPGDTAAPKAASHRVGAHAGGRGARRAGANLAHTLAVHRRVDAVTPGRRSITSAIRGHALGSPGSDHRHGRALDVTGTNLNAYAANLRRIGGFAEHHGTGSSRHLHAAIGDTPRPRAGTIDEGGAGGTVITFREGAIVVHATTELDVELAVYNAIARRERERAERSPAGR
jgi:hypothetical protein